MPPSMKASAEDAVVIDAIVDYTQSLLDGFAEFSRRTEWRTQPNSPAAHELDQLRRKMGPAGAWSGDELEYAKSSAWILLMAEHQHLAGLRTLYANYDIAFPIVPVARSIMEAAGRVAWLLDPRIGSRDRAARALLARIDDTDRQRSAAKSPRHVDRRAFEREHRRLLREVLPGQFDTSEIVWPTDDSPLAVRRQVVPSLRQSQRVLSEIQPTPWNATGHYDYLSSVSHSTTLFVLEMWGKDPNAAEGTSPRHTIRLDDATFPQKVWRAAAITFGESWALFAAYHGIDYDDVNALLRGIDLLPEPTSLSINDGAS